MSKESDNRSFAGMLQRHLKTHPVGKGFYAGEEDEWAGPSTVSCWRESVGLAPKPAPVIVEVLPVLNDLPRPASSYRTPVETVASMTAFYGKPSESPDYLDWFSFPDPDTRLYGRDGALLKNYSGDVRLDHKCHRLLIGRLTAAMSEIFATLGAAEFRKQGWHLYGGCHNYRQKRGGSSLSTHAWGVAIDLNIDENPFQATRTTFSDAAIDIMERWGFLSGGRAWGKDWQHFQAVIPNISSGSYYAKNGLPKNLIQVVA